MASPIRHLLSPKVVSYLSPVIHNAAAAPKRCVSDPPRQNLKSSARNLFKPINLESNTNAFSKIRNFELFPDVNAGNAKIKVEVTDCSNHKPLQINSPNKRYVLQNGLSKTLNTSVLGKGSFGTVVQGTYKGSDVAVKVVKIRRSFLREHNALKFNHPNITKVIDIIQSCESNYGIILMEYVKFSQTLQNILDDYSIVLNGRSIAKYALDICKGLQYCHRNGVLHLDVKPSNVLVCDYNSCKLCDFGNSVKVGDNRQVNVYQGTAAYAAPELLTGQRPTHKSDVYSFGIVLWQLKYREDPYTDIDCREIIIYKVVKFNHRPNSNSVCVQDEYFTVYSRCWDASPSMRPELCELIDIFTTCV